MPTTYDTLIEAASRLEVSDAKPAELETLSEAELQAILEPNLAAYEQARAALQDKPRLADPDEALSPEKREKDRSHLYNLSQYLKVGARLAELQGDFAEVARVGFCEFELGNAIQSGGNPNDSILTMGSRFEGLDYLRTVRDRFDDATRREAIERLIEWEKDMVPIIPPFQLGLDQQESSDDTDEPPTGNEFSDIFLECRTVAMVRMLVIDLALRSYYEAEGRYPERLTTLETIVPEGLPLDPYTAAPFNYRREGNHAFHLYSPGPSGVDHGGIYGDLSAVTDGMADLCLDFSDL